MRRARCASDDDCEVGECRGGGGGGPGGGGGAFVGGGGIFMLSMPSTAVSNFLLELESCLKSLCASFLESGFPLDKVHSVLSMFHPCAPFVNASRMNQSLNSPVSL